ncbi:metallophosphoesterase [Ruminiclostridium papyrosolvens C7]|uniref:Metallophosphoesterase n=2 Tax=Ruminiclostridium papyrosolvens TaxID=29362 RepID=U4R6I3_9FIRM|nr:metallophosphoesterase [Ruminiclostridium papyrosolvens C7]
MQLTGVVYEKRLIMGLFTVFLLISLSFNCFHAEASEKPFTMVWLSDPQYYAESYPQIYDCLGDWFVKNYKHNSFGYLIVSGDIVDTASCVNQWEVASRNFQKLDDANVPYGVLAGNHDVITNGLNYSIFKSYFGASRYIDKPWYGGSMDDNRNHYDLISFSSHDFIILYLGFGSETSLETTTWANSVLEKYPNRNAILVLHEYLDTDGEMTEKAKIVSDSIVLKNDNVFMVLCGHYHGAQKKFKMVCNSDGTTRKVLEILSDYQKAPNGGNGFLRFLKFCPRSGTLKVSLYSPFTKKDSYLGEGIDNFTETIELID